MSTQPTTAVVIESAAQEFADATSTPPFIYELAPAEAREVLEGVQRAPIDKPDVDIEDLMIAGGPHGHIAARLIKPAGSTGTLPVILYVHGAGWVLGSPQTHDLLVRNLAVVPRPPSCSPITCAHPKRSTHPRSRRPTRRQRGSSITAANMASIPATWQSRATRSGAT